MDEATFKWLNENFTSEKVYMKDGYYRFRELEPGVFDMAFLEPCSCGTSNVHPQITLEKKGDVYIPIKLIDFDVTPPLLINREESTLEFLDQSLHQLIEKFKRAII